MALTSAPPGLAVPDGALFVLLHLEVVAEEQLHGDPGEAEHREDDDEERGGAEDAVGQQTDPTMTASVMASSKPRPMAVP